MMGAGWFSVCVLLSLLFQPSHLASSNYPCVKNDVVVVEEVESGEIRSPNYPGKYPNSWRCRWLIQPEDGYAPMLTTTDLELHGGWWGWFPDTVDIYDGDSTSAPNLGTLSPGSELDTYTATGGSMLVDFKSNSGYTARGFNSRFNNTAVQIPTTVGPTTESPAGSANCDFENNLCGWTQDDTDIFDWARNSGPTPSDDTGPSVDHTTNTGGGFYLYAEASAPQTMNDWTRLRSPELPASDLRCLRFWYHMNGLIFDMGVLKVFLDVGGVETLVFLRDDHQGDIWHSGLAELSSPSANYNVIFEAITYGYYGRSDIAIDDITFTEGACVSPSIGCGQNFPASQDPTIFNGDLAESGEFPWQVLLHRYIPNSYDYYIYGASLISPQLVITAAHAVDNTDGTYNKFDIKLIFGSTDRTHWQEHEFSLTPTEIVLHPDRDYVTVGHNNVALLKLPYPIVATQLINPVCLPASAEPFPSGTECIMSGWGYLQYNGPLSIYLQHVAVEMTNVDVCDDFFLDTVDQTSICGLTESKAQHFCPGDDGGPFVCYDSNSGAYVQQGVILWTVADACGDYAIQSPGVHASLPYYLSWINGVLNAEQD